jgi:hypothetical protein
MAAPSTRNQVNPRSWIDAPVDGYTQPVESIPWDVLTRILRSVAILICALGYLMAGYILVLYHRAPRWDVFLPPLLLAAAGTITLGARLSYTAKALLLVAAIWGAATLANLFFPQLPMGLSYVMVCLVAGVLLGPPTASVAGALGTAAIIVQARLFPGPQSVGGNLVALWACVALIWAVLGNLYLAVLRAEASAESAWAQVR